ncbi:MAG TPA: hypothetical protein VF941_21440 [Clostridia bacterium]
MKINKKFYAPLAFTLGALIFASTAFADVAMGSGYDRLKDSIKNTSAKLDKGFNSYTMDTTIVMKDNGSVLVQSPSKRKVDNLKDAEESMTETISNGRSESSYYNYNDNTCYISKNNNDDTYYVQNRPKDLNNPQRRSRDPFAEKDFKEVEKIFDAIVGNLKNNVQVENASGGGKEYSGNLSETQVPSLINAVMSFGFKRYIADSHTMDIDGKNVLPEFDSDLSVRKVSGKAFENRDGVLENILGEVSITGKDKKGTIHELTFSVSAKLYDINKTTVSKPDLNGKKVEVTHNGLDERYIGKYKNDMVIEKDGKFTKIGERVLEITKIDDDKICGKYHETLKPGFESYLTDKYDFEFQLKNGTDLNAFDYKDSSGKDCKGILHQRGNRNVALSLNVKIDNYGDRGVSWSSDDRGIRDNSDFIRVFEN